MLLKEISRELPCLRSPGMEFHSLVETRSPLATGPDFGGKKNKQEENVWFWFDVYFEHVKTKTKRKQSGWDFHCRQTHSGIKEKSNIKNMIFRAHARKGSARKSLLHLFTCFSALTFDSCVDGTQQEQILPWLHHHLASLRPSLVQPLCHFITELALFCFVAFFRAHKLQFLTYGT